MKLSGDESNLVMPPGKQPSTKKKVRALLMFSARVAIPLAIGSAGTSLAITTGACALIGAALCDDHRYVHGAVRGAWEGCGLSIFDPLVQKGSQIAVPAGSIIDLSLSAPAEIPEWWLEQMDKDSRQAALSTSARLLNCQSLDKGEAPMPVSTEGRLAEVLGYLNTKNMARALEALAAIPPDQLQDPAVKAVQEQVLLYVTGQDRRQLEDKVDAKMPL